MANFVYNYGKLLLANSNLALLSDNIALMLVNSSYESSASANTIVDEDTVSAIASYEISVSGYSRQVLTSKAVTETDDGDNQPGFAYFSAANVTFANLTSGQTIGGAVLIRDTGSNSTSALIAFYDIIDTPTNGGDITIQWANSVNGGVLKLS